MWFLILFVGSLIMFCAPFRVKFGLETRAEKRARVLGTAPREPGVLEAKY